ncbi:hypothetical protein PITC_014740 [Penicillium italicum]|uniref:Uncharacterized protein n=1 Tax=Penicillium italicum TaxID=40296 RepID=A0A0A2KRS1_PENIT|nr:hypothetical protein PITC_014740 [Penicillium italicum]
MTSIFEPYLPAFNGQVDLKKAYGWSLMQIQVFMIEVIDEPSTYGVDMRVVSELKQIRTDIIDLTEKGSRYQSEAPPPQAILRKVNPAPSYYDDISSLMLDAKTYGGLPYWSLFDLLGRFLSLTGPAPQGATQDNFYLPLTLMYTNWSQKMAPRAPWVYSCVWAEEEDKQSRFHMGASLGGYRIPDGEPNGWCRALQRARFDVLHDERIQTAGIRFEDTPLTGRTGNPIPFGNCAETYPLVNILRNRAPSEEVFGLAVMLDALPRTGEYDHEQAMSTMIRPCANCQRVITTWGGEVENFIIRNYPEGYFLGGEWSPAPSSERASDMSIDLSTGAKRPAPADDIAEPEAKRAKGWRPEVPKKPSHLAMGKGRQQ